MLSVYGESEAGVRTKLPFKLRRYPTFRRVVSSSEAREGSLRIGELADASGVTAKTVRHYESIGLIPSAGRRNNSYRNYDEGDVHRLRFIRRARDLGFSVDQVRDLLLLWSARDRSDADVRAVALGYVAELDERMAQMREMVDALHRLADACDGTGRPEYPFLRSPEEVPGARRGGPRRAPRSRGLADGV